MKSKYNLIYDQVKNEIQTANVIDSGILWKGIFVNLVTDFFWTEFLIPAFQSHNCTRQEALILLQMITAIIAQSMQSGLCVELAAAVLVKSLELEIPECKELIELKGKSLKKDFSGYAENGKKEFQSYTSHNLVIFGRDQLKSDLAQISTWRGITIIDTWKEGRIHKYDQDEYPKDIHLTSGYFAPETIKCIILIENNLCADDWKKYAELLEGALEQFKLKFKTWFEDENSIPQPFKQWHKNIRNKNVDFSEEITMICKTFRSKIDEYRRYSHRISEEKELKPIVRTRLGISTFAGGLTGFAAGSSYIFSSGIVINVSAGIFIAGCTILGAGLVLLAICLMSRYRSSGLKFFERDGPTVINDDVLPGVQNQSTRLAVG